MNSNWLLSVAEGQRTRNYLSCCSWIFLWSIHYLSHSSLSPTFSILPLPLSQSSLSHSLNPPSPTLSILPLPLSQSSLFLSQSSLFLSLTPLSSLPLSHSSISLPVSCLPPDSLSLLPIANYQYKIAADPGAGIGLAQNEAVNLMSLFQLGYKSKSGFVQIKNSSNSHWNTGASSSINSVQPWKLMLHHKKSRTYVHFEFLLHFKLT